VALVAAKNKLREGVSPPQDRIVSICRSQSPFLSKGNYANKRSRLVEDAMAYHRADIIVNDLSHLTRRTSIKQVLAWLTADINLAADFV
jgi:hypothetical protein